MKRTFRARLSQGRFLLQRYHFSALLPLTSAETSLLWGHHIVVHFPLEAGESPLAPIVLITCPYELWRGIMQATRRTCLGSRGAGGGGSAHSIGLGTLPV